MPIAINKFQQTHGLGESVKLFITTSKYLL